MRAISRKMICSLCVLGLGYLGLQLGHPHSALADMGCSNATLKGTYLFAYDGWQIDADNVRKPFAFSGIEIYNGDGTAAWHLFEEHRWRRGPEGRLHRDVDDSSELYGGTDLHG